VQHWKRKILNAGVSLSVVGGGVLLAEGAVGAHDAVDHDGPAHHQGFRHLVQGVVASVGTGTFTITTHRGVTKTIDTTSTTVFSETGTPVVPATVAVGQSVAVSLDPTNPTPTALRVAIVLNRISGKVLSVTPTSITLTGPHNAARVVTILSGTMFFSGTTSATGVTVGEFVSVFGNPDATTPTDFDAMFVDIGFAHPQPVGTPVVPPAVPNPNPGIGRGDDHGDHDNDGDNDNGGVGDNDNDANEHPNGDVNDGQEHATPSTTNVTPTTPGATQQVPPNGNGINGGGGSGSGRGGPGPSDGGGSSAGHGDDGGGSSGGGNGSGGHGGRG
jgi:uncharacterized membrane protein YgcG